MESLRLRPHVCAAFSVFLPRKVSSSDDDDIFEVPPVVKRTPVKSASKGRESKQPKITPEKQTLKVRRSSSITIQDSPARTERDDEDDEEDKHELATAGGGVKVEKIDDDDKGPCGVKQEGVGPPIKSEFGVATVKLEPGNVTVKQESGRSAIVKQEPGSGATVQRGRPRGQAGEARTAKVSDDDALKAALASSPVPAGHTRPKAKAKSKAKSKASAKGKAKAKAKCKDKGKGQRAKAAARKSAIAMEPIPPYTRTNYNPTPRFNLITFSEAC